MSIDRTDMKWNGWGWANHKSDLAGNDAVWSWMASTLGVDELATTPAKSLDDITLPPSRLSETALSKLTQALDDARVKSDTFERAFHARGKSYRDLLDLRAGSIDDAPDAIVYPETEAEVFDILKIADEEALTLIPYGGGSSVVGGINPVRGESAKPIITLDTTRMNRVLSIDPIAMTAVVQPGIYGPDLEEQLLEQGFTLGHYPQSFEFSTLGGWIAHRGAGQQSTRYGKAEKWLVSVKLATENGLWTTEAFPASAAGPNLNQMILGSEGTLGIITEATIKLHHTPEVKDYRAYLMKDFTSGAKAMREMCQAEVPLAMARLSDADETRFFQAFAASSASKSIAGKLKSILQKSALKSRGFSNQPCLLMIGIEGDTETTDYGRKASAAIAKKNGALALGRKPGDAWYHGRFNSPYSRDPMMDRSLGVDTLETSTNWSNIEHLYTVVCESLATTTRQGAPGTGARGIVMTHISHVYPDGASLYFTFVFPRDLENEVEQWLKIKTAASNVIVTNGGTISHHHGIGTDHAPWMEAEKGPIGLSLLAAVKNDLDPKGILNPGKLISTPKEN